MALEPQNTDLASWRGPSRSTDQKHGFPSGSYLEGQGDLVSRLIIGIFRVTIWVIGVINLLTKSP